MAEKYSDQVRRETRDSEKPGHGRIWSAYCARVADRIAIFEDTLERLNNDLRAADTRYAALNDKLEALEKFLGYTEQDE